MANRGFELSDVKKRKSGGKRQVERLQLIRKHWFGGRCMWQNGNDTQCSKKDDLELAHALDTQLSKDQPNGFRSSFARLQDTLDNPECFLLLCRKHHREFDGRTTEAYIKNYVGELDL